MTATALTSASAAAPATPESPTGAAARLRRCASVLVYSVVGVAFGLLCLLEALLVVLAAALAAAGPKTPLHVVAPVGRAFGRADRRMANRLLQAKIPPPAVPLLSPSGLARGGGALLRDRRMWQLVGHLVLRFLVAAAVLVVAAAAVWLAGALLVLGVQGLAGVGDAEVAGPLSVNAATGALLVALAAPVVVLLVAALDGSYALLRGLLRRIFLRPTSGPAAPVREILAQSLGDRTLSIAYFLPDRGAYVDESGRAVALPDPRSGRAWTAVDHDGRRVAAIIHDAALDASAELVQAAAAAASLALDNERLKADLRARLEELRVSRLRIVEASDEARRRLERDLHDGAQQQLVSLALDLRLLKARLKGHEATEQVDALTAKLQQALAELRELARGIHPAILTQQGLGPALEALAARCSVPVTLDVELDDERLPPAVEAASYFVVSEALANVGKYAEASAVRIAVLRGDAHVEVVVQDDGRGGADARTGSGLRGLEDRLAALDGALAVHSPPGEGTRLVARMPLEQH